MLWEQSLSYPTKEVPAAIICVKKYDYAAFSVLDNEFRSPNSIFSLTLREVTYKEIYLITLPPCESRAGHFPIRISFSRFLKLLQCNLCLYQAGFEKSPSIFFSADTGKVSTIQVTTVKQNLKLGNEKQKNSFLDFKNKNVHLQVNTFPCFGISNHLLKKREIFTLPLHLKMIFKKKILITKLLHDLLQQANL